MPPSVALQVVSTRDEQLLAEVCREAAMFSGPPHPHVVSALGLCTSHAPHLLVTQYTDWVSLGLILFIDFLFIFGGVGCGGR